MSWKVSDPMSERVKFIGLYESGERTVAGLSMAFGISRKTAYKWIERYRQEGLKGLYERPRTPHHHPQETPPAVQETLLEARRKHPTWGPKKLGAWLERRQPELQIPAPSTIGDILKREGLVKPRRFRRRLPVPEASPVAEVTRPNEEWDADFKGEFRLGNGTYCYPLTISDAFSRYLVRVRALEGTGTTGAWRIFERAFQELGLPEGIRSDNGTPFASTALARLSALSVWWIKLGIRPITIRPGKPQDNGRHERMHRTLKAQTTRPPAWDNPRQQHLFDRFRKEYNDERPHEALGQKPPVEFYRSSARPYPSKLQQVEYDSHFEVRKVVSNGVFHWKDQKIFVTKILAGERVGLVEIDDGCWRVYFSRVELGILDEATLKRGRLGKVLPMSPV